MSPIAIPLPTSSTERRAFSIRLKNGFELILKNWKSLTNDAINSFLSPSKLVRFSRIKARIEIDFISKLMGFEAATVADMKIDGIAKKITRIYLNNDVINSTSRVCVENNREKFVRNQI